MIFANFLSFFKLFPLELGYLPHGGLMTRSRAFTRSNRFNAKKRRRTLRTAVPSLSKECKREPELADHSDGLMLEALNKEVMLDLLEP